MSQVDDCPTGSSNTNVHQCLTPGMRIGLAFTAQSGFISLAAIVVVFILIIRNVIRCVRDPPPGKWNLVQQPADVYMLSMFTSDILQALGAILDVRWVDQGFVQTGGFCNAQGAIQQLGETGVAMATLALAVHTFITIWLRKGTRNRTVAIAVVALIWIYLLIYTAIGPSVHKEENYFAPTPYWCWLRSDLLPERITGEYLWLWLALFGSLLLYLLLFFWHRGNIVVDGKRWWVLRVHWSARTDDDDARARPAASSMAIIAYPVVYALVVLPFSAVRWYTFRGHTVPPAVTFTVTFLFGLSGAFNVVLLLTMRPELLLFGVEHQRAWKGRVAGGRRAVRGSGVSMAPVLRPPPPPRMRAHVAMQYGQLNVSVDDGWHMPDARWSMATA